MTNISPLERLAVGERKGVRKTITESDVYLFAGIVGDFHPNHVDEVYARAHLGARIAHGALLPGFISRATVELIGDRLTPPGYAAQTFSLKFVAPVFIGDTIEAMVEIVAIVADRRKIVMSAEVRNQDGKVCALGDTTIKVLRENTTLATADNKALD
jgi:3-hydroxybutyryl-CoA dehydratase